MSRSLFVSRFSAWAPGVENPEDWREWAGGKREISASNESPALDYADSKWLALNPKDFTLFKRRLSQISRMAVQVLHGIMPIGEQTKIVFVSVRGEIRQQFKINAMLIEEGDLGPAVFSHSVFNTPAALACIALDLRGGYSAIYPAGGTFQTGFLAAAAPLFAGNETEIVLVYADELCPPEYGRPEAWSPLAFAALLSSAGPGIPLSAERGFFDSPSAFLKYLYMNGNGQC